MIRSFWPYITRERETKKKEKKREKQEKLVAPPKGWNLNHFLFRGEISLCSRRFCVSFEVLNRGEVARGLRRRIQVFLLKPLLRVPIELIDRYTLFLRGPLSSRSPPLSPPPPDPRLRRRKQPAVPSALILTFSFFLTTAGKRATTPIHKSAWFIALLVLIAILLIVLLIFVLYTRRRGSKYPGKTIMVIEVRGVWHHVLLKAKILSSFFVNAEMDNIENKLDCVLNTRYSCKALICFISRKLVNARRNEPLISSTGNHSMKKKVLTNTKGKRMPGIIYIFAYVWTTWKTYRKEVLIFYFKVHICIWENELQLLKSNTDKDLARNCI